LNQLLQSKKISAYHPDVYKREVERYGEKTIKFCEKWFEYDSVCTINSLSKNQFKNRWEFAIHSIDRLLNDFKLSDEDKVEFLHDLSSRFNLEFQVNTPLNQELNMKYRSHSIRMFELFNGDQTIWDEELNKRSFQSIDLIEEILKADPNYITNLIPSLVHMLMNRIFLMNQRKYEMILYNFLYKYYKSSLARKIKNRDLIR
jgi:thiopeptide-type bacteriocin biosynthesis protein